MEMRQAIPQSAGGMALPQTVSVQDAVARARDGAPDFLFNHVMRCAFFAELYRRSHAREADAETVALAALLHDLGFHCDCEMAERFELRSARLARTFLEERGIDPVRTWLIWDTIALHTHDLNLHKEAEARAVQTGILVDVVGAGIEALDQGAVSAIVQAFPRLNFKRCFAGLLESDARHDVQLPPFHPTVMVRHAAGNMLDIPDAAALIAAAPFDE